LVKIHAHLFWSSTNIPFLQHIRQGSHHCQDQKSIQEPAFFPATLLQKLLSPFQRSCGIFPHFNPKSDACPLLLKLCCFLRHTTIPTVTAHTPLVHNSTPLSKHMRYSPTSNSKSLSRLYLLTPSSSCVTSRSVHKSSDHIMYSAFGKSQCT